MAARPRLSTWVDVSITKEQVVLVKHAGINGSDDLRWAMGNVLNLLADIRTPYLNPDNAENEVSRVMLAKYLCDVREGAEQLFQSDQREAAQEYLHLPRLVVRGERTQLLRLEKDVSLIRRLAVTTIGFGLSLPLVLPLLLLSCEGRRLGPVLRNATNYSVFGPLFLSQRVVRLQTCYALEQIESWQETATRSFGSAAGLLRQASTSGSWPC